MKSSGGRLIRTMAFSRKDLLEVLRQPRLLLTLVLGPLLILLIFGVGFAPAPSILRTIVVVPPGSGLESRSQELANALCQRIALTEMTDNESAARDRIAAGDADVLVVVPANAAELVRANQQAPIEIYHNQIDPFESSFIEIFADSAVDEINQAILEEVVAAGQLESADVEGSLPAARAAVDAMSGAVERGGEIAPTDRLDLEGSLLGLATVAAYRSGIVGGVDDIAGRPTSATGALARAQDSTTQLGEPGSSPQESQQILTGLRSDLDLIEEELAVFREMEPGVLVSPFVGTIDNVQGIDVDFSHYYMPGVVALLLQHLALTFAALSLVRERTLGSAELFRVSPLTAGEALTGKYLAYLVLVDWLEPLSLRPPSPGSVRDRRIDDLVRRRRVPGFDGITRSRVCDLRRCSDRERGNPVRNDRTPRIDSLQRLLHFPRPVDRAGSRPLVPPTGHLRNRGIAGRCVPR
ncbi:MAG TPA: hypothetical protein VM848_00925 [Acidimicrobiia bacterium]|nr:hypothetical protein [Acidimicrobiia bacterium]